MRYLSLFSGIEAASVAWRPLGWKPVAFAEIDRYACCVLRRRHPLVRNLGDVNKYREWPNFEVDLVVGGSPCQAFSVAGHRLGLDDPRGNLAIAFCHVVARYRPRWVVWENVPGVLFSNQGRDFAAIIGALGKCGYGLAWRVLDAQYVRVAGYCTGVPQRRRRVFLVGYLGDWRRAAAVLFDTAGGQGHSPPRREKTRGRRGVDPGETESGAGSSFVPDVANILTGRMHKGINTTMDEGQTLLAFDHQRSGEGLTVDCSPPLITTGAGAVYGPTVVLNIRQNPVHSEEVALPLSTYNDNHAVFTDASIRRLTPREAERLQGFPDDYTLVKGPNGRMMSDTQRYKMLGNSMPVNVMRWIGMRIEMVEAI